MKIVIANVMETVKNVRVIKNVQKTRPTNDGKNLNDVGGTPNCIRRLESI